jgi:hypothetical protein
MSRTKNAAATWSDKIRFLLIPLALLSLGFVWAIASPQGSSADDDFHTASIYCAWGNSDVCTIDPATGLPFVPEYLVQSQCYVDFPATQGAGCLKEISGKYVTTPRFASDQNVYAPLYFRTVNVFASSDYPQTVLLIRLFNVALASLLLAWAMWVSTPAVKRGLALSWGVALAPVGTFFIASINPSAWLIASIGTFWAFLVSAISSKPDKSVRTVFLWVGLVFSMIVALGARTDAVIYLSITAVSVVIWRWKSIIAGLGLKRIIPLAFVLAVGLFVGTRIFLNRFTSFNFTFPGAHTGTDQPNAIIKTLVEVPAFVLGLLGGQRPLVGLSTGPGNWLQEGSTYAGFGYGLGWTDFSLPPLVSIFAGMGLAALIFITMRQYSVSKVLSLAFVVLSTLALILLLRATFAFAWTNEIQPRYIFPIFLAFVGLALTVRLRKNPLLNRLQVSVLFLGIWTSSSIAWLATATRYAVGPNAAYTNFGQTPAWWWNIGPGRLGWFLITVVVSGVWAFATIWVWGRMSRSSFKEEVRAKVAS